MELSCGRSSALNPNALTPLNVMKLIGFVESRKSLEINGLRLLAAKKGMASSILTPWPAFGHCLSLKCRMPVGHLSLDSDTTELLIDHSGGKPAAENP